MVTAELIKLINSIQSMQCEGQTIEVKAAHEGCPEKLYDTLSSFSNQDSGGTIVFGLDEKHGFKPAGVYNAQELQKKVMEYCEQMTPAVRAVFTNCEIDGMVFVSAEIPPLDAAERPCFRSAKGRIRGSYVRVGDADKPMTEYEVYSYEAFRKKYMDDVRPVNAASLSALDQSSLDSYRMQKTKSRPNLARLPLDQLYELTGITRNSAVTMSAVLLFCPYPQVFFPQLSIIACRVPGTEMGQLSQAGLRFTDSRRIDGNIPEMLTSALAFVESNMRVSTAIDPQTGMRKDTPEYPMDAVREAVLNALVHRDYSIHTEGMPIQLTMYSDRLEITNPGGLYGRLTLDQLGKAQPDTRNPVLVTAMEAIGQTENRYSGIPRIRHAMQEAHLPAPVFSDERGIFSVCLYNGSITVEAPNDIGMAMPKSQALLLFCKTPRTRQEITDFLGVASASYAMRKYIRPLLASGQLRLTLPDKPQSSKQKYYSV